jgi:hypothetical protein
MRTLPLTCASAIIGVLVLSSAAATQTPTQRVFATPEDAVNALIETVKTGSIDALLAIFGPDGQELIASSDPATARSNRNVFKVAAGEQWHLEDAAPDRKTLVIGYEDWPFPVQLAKGADGWRFDTAAGVGSGNSGRSIPEILAGGADTPGEVASSIPRCRVRSEGPSRVSIRPRSRIRSTIACARSSSWSTRPQAVKGLFVVKIMARFFRCRSLTTWKSMFAASVPYVR